MTSTYRSDKRKLEFDVMYDKDQPLCKNSSCQFSCKALHPTTTYRLFQAQTNFYCALMVAVKYMRPTKAGIIRAPSSCPLHKATTDERIDVIVSGIFGAT